MRKLAAAFLQHKALVDALIFLVVLPAYYVLPVTADTLPNRSLELGTSAAGAVSSYYWRFTLPGPAIVGSMKLELCANSPLEGDACTPPSGLDATGASLNGQAGVTDFAISRTTQNSVTLSRSVGMLGGPQNLSYLLENIINPSVVGSYYGRISVYSSTDASGSPVDFSGLAVATVSTVQVNSRVPPYLIFCSGITVGGLDCSQASGDYVNFGEFSPTHTSSAASQMVAATNAGNGYYVQVAGTTMTSGNNEIAALASPSFSQAGAGQFGLNLRSNSSPAVGSDPTGPGSGAPASPYNIANQFRFEPNDTLVLDPHADGLRKYTVSYIVNVPSGQPPGIYASTLTYVCVPNF